MNSLTDRQIEAANLLGENLKHPRIGAVLGLVEELGELVKEVMEAEIYNQDRPELRERMSDEVADVLFSLFEVCTAYNINLEQAYERKLEKIQGKIPKWTQLYSAGLKITRSRFD